MATTSGRGTSCCVVLFLALTSVSAVQRLNTINDLKKINFGQSGVPKHSLLLLYWFASIIEDYNHNDIRLTFDPNNGEYGSHHYGNYEGLLGLTSYGQKYYTVGNIKTDEHVGSLPDYVTRPRAEYHGGNRDRIIVRVQNGILQRIDRVFITQHYRHAQHVTEYDPAHTYEITAHLLRQIRRFSGVTSRQELSVLSNHFGSSANEWELQNIRSTWGVLAGLGLLLFIVLQERYNYNAQFNQQSSTPQGAAQRNTQPHYSSNFVENRQNQWIDDICGILGVVIVLAVFICLILASGSGRWSQIWGEH